MQFIYFFYHQDKMKDYPSPDPLVDILGEQAANVRARLLIYATTCNRCKISRAKLESLKKIEAQSTQSRFVLQTKIDKARDFQNWLKNCPNYNNAVDFERYQTILIEDQTQLNKHADQQQAQRDIKTQTLAYNADLEQLRKMKVELATAIKRRDEILNTLRAL
jgi:hypothetical protein